MAVIIVMAVLYLENHS
ncbi:TPA: hypothetical protein ACUKRW_001512 [Escherichia coli]